MGELQSGTVKMLHHTALRNLKFNSVTPSSSAAVGTRNKRTLDADPRHVEMQYAISLVIEPPCVSSFPERCGSAAKSAKPARQRDESNSSRRVVFRHPRNKGRSR